MRTRRLLALLVLLTLVSGARAHLIIFKDGFTIHGKVRQRGEMESDGPSGQSVWIPKGSFVIDSDARRIYFSHGQIQHVDDRDLDKGLDIVQFAVRVPRFNPGPMYPLNQVVGATPFNDKWERTFKFRISQGRIDTPQRIGYISPMYLRLDALKYNWSAYHMTKEFDPATIREILWWHADMKLKSDKLDAARHFVMYRFMAQAGWYDQAEAELNSISKDFPEEKEKVQTARDAVKRLRTLQLLEDIELAYQAGRHRWALEHLNAFNQEGVEEAQLTGIRALKAKYDTVAQNLTQAVRFLKELPPKLELPSATRELFKEAARDIGAEVTHESVGRLEAFIRMAEQAERDQKQEKAPAHTPAQLLSLAMSGWLMGKDAAEAKVETAVRLWTARKFILEHQKTNDAMARAQMLKDYLARKSEAVGIDEMSQIIGFLPPPEPERDLTPDPVELRTDLPGGRTKKDQIYLLQLPPEYHHGRSYPVLIALHPGGEKPKAIFDRFRAMAARHGYILVAPDWDKAVDGNYNYTAEEHTAVLDVIRDLRRRFQVDSDRVFLTGNGDGANMAFDVGLSHPDLFAGVLPMSGRPRFFGVRYARNGQYLPFYIVDGGLAGENPKFNRKLIEEWVPKGYPSLYVEYRGRGSEWFDSELPSMFDWMDHKKGLRKRANAIPNLGQNGGGGPFGQEFQTLRTTDNRFYWLTTDAIDKSHINDAANWKNEISAATLQGRVEENQINVNVRCLHQVSVWLTKEMIDFSKPVTLRLNGAPAWLNRKVPPSMATMLEDLYQRGDRQRLYWARLDFKP